jgi:hypothetical protein
MSKKTFLDKVIRTFKHFLEPANHTKNHIKSAVGRGAKHAKNSVQSAWDKAVECLDVETCSAYQIDHAGS